MIKLSKLPKTWIFDLDGTICKHNGYKLDGKDTILSGASEFFSHIPSSDRVIILTSREKQYKKQTLEFLKENNIRFDQIIFDLPVGERILVNDIKPKGLKTSIAINTKRDEFLNETFIETDK